ncbi:aspartate-semialdehyde dehydrogenase [[Clostridium] innocuum]|nr:aspartate-semialdehyde dehydrogenase [[Clostridium] innocuum]
MKTYKVAILGATGAVGQEMLKILMERDFPISELHLLASARSAGKKITVAGKEYTVEETTEDSFDGMDIVLGAAENDIAEKYLPIAAAKGAIVVDNSSAFRLHEDVPLIVPEVNPQAVREHHGIIANPNCATIIALVALQPLHAYANAKRMVVSTYQAVSGAGVNGIRELNQQVGALAHGKEVEVNTFQYQIAYNLIPQIGGFNAAGYSSEEMKMQNEGRKIMGNPELCVNCTCIRVPVIRSHSESIMVEFEKEISVEKARELLQNAPGVKLVDDPQNMVYPMPLDTTDQDLVYVGRIREDMSNHANALSFWCCGDQVRKGAATNAVQIAELVIQEKER